MSTIFRHTFTSTTEKNKGKNKKSLGGCKEKKDEKASKMRLLLALWKREGLQKSREPQRVRRLGEREIHRRECPKTQLGMEVDGIDQSKENYYEMYTNISSKNTCQP